MRDLFTATDKRTVAERLLQLVNSQLYTKTSDIARWGVEHYSNTATREARNLCSAGKIRRIPDEEKLIVFGKIKEDVYAPIKVDIERVA